MRASVAALCVAALALAAPPLAAQAPEVDEILDRLSLDSAHLDSLIAAFRQVEKDEFGDETVLTGSFYYLKPARFKWSLVVGGKVVEEMVSDGKLGWRVRHGVKAVDKVQLATIKRRTGGITLTGGAEELKELYDITYIATEELEAGPAYRLLCTPKAGSTGADSLILQLEIWVNLEYPAPVAKLVVHQRDDIVTSLEFSNLRRNAYINPRVFKYRVPRGYDEITH